MSKSILISIVLIMGGIYCQVIGQKSPEKRGNIYFEAAKYFDALKAYNQIKKINKDPQLLIKRGQCYLHTNRPDECIKDMAAAHQLKSLDNQRYKYSAQAYFSKGEYEEAAKFYKTYLNTLKPKHPEYANIILEIKKCGYARNKKFNSQLAFVENFGENINTEYDEFGPKQSPTKVGRYYFSSSRVGSIGGLRDPNGLEDEMRGHYSSDIYYLDLIDGNWTEVQLFDALINTSKNEVLQDFNSDGSVMYYLKSSTENLYNLYTDTFHQEKISDGLPTPVVFGQFNAAIGDKDLSLFNDSLMLFSSKRSGGFGGFDLYYSVYRYGYWQEAVNFGTKINTPYDEISPFLVKNGDILYYSSNQWEGLGGFDIFKSNYEGNNWSQPINLFAPINTPRDEINIEISSDGTQAVFASNRIVSKGGFDLYIAYFKEQVTDQLDIIAMPQFVNPKDEMSDVDSNGSSTQQVEDLGSNLPVKEIILKPLYFTNDDEVLSNQNIGHLKILADIMQIHPEVNLLVQSHNLPESRRSVDLFFSIKRAEKISEQLAKFGIPSSRIILQGLGSNFSLAAPMIQGMKSSLAEKTNQRIDLDLIKDEKSPLKIVYERPVVADIFRDSKWDTFAAKNQRLTFRVKFAETNQMLQSELLTTLPDIILEKNGTDSKYTYTAGNFETLAEAEALQNTLKEDNVSNTSIKVYYQGRPVMPNEIEKLLKDYPDFKYWSEK